MEGGKESLLKLHRHQLCHCVVYLRLLRRYNIFSNFADSPPFTIFLVAGISVSDLSTPTNIILSNVSLETGGKFKCEVSGGPPR